MALSQTQTDLVDLLVLSDFNRDEIIGIMLPVAKNEPAMEELIIYLIKHLKAGNKPSESDVLGKVFQILGIKDKSGFVS